MRTSFMIYIRAVGLYSLLTLPAILLPLIYLISIIYVLIDGWFAWGLFSMIYLLTDKLRMNYASKMFILVIGVILSVAFAFQMLEILEIEENVWQSGWFIWFPVIAVIAGWVSLYLARKQVQADCPGWMEPAGDYEELGETS